MNSGVYGIWLHLDSRDNLIDRNEISEGGAGGVLLASARLSYQDDSKLYTPGPGAAKAAPLGDQITRNHIHHRGRIRYYCSGVHLDSRPAGTALMAGNYVAHNHLHHLSRNGIFASGIRAAKSSNTTALKRSCSMSKTAAPSTSLP